MDVQATGPASATTASGATTAAFSEDFNTFLTLLTAQVENQDPLSPLDSTQFVEQLATFSSLEQQVTANDYLERIAELLAANLGLPAQGPAEEG